MVSYSFLLPESLPEPVSQGLSRAFLLSGTEYVPWPTEVLLKDNELTVQCHANESSCLSAPWPVDGRGHVLHTSGNLMPRGEPYHLVLELARGKVNHVRTQAADWEMGGLVISDELRSALRAMTQAFIHAACNQDNSSTIRRFSQEAIDRAAVAGEQLLSAYVNQVFHFRLVREQPLATTLACRINGSVPDASRTALLRETFNGIQIPFLWPSIEPSEGEYVWEATDALLSWAEGKGWEVVGGPVIDFGNPALPAWLSRYRGDLRRLINYMDDYLEMVLQRYGDRIRTWELTAASNLPHVLGLNKDELLHLTNRLFDTAQQLKPDLAFVLGLAQPWGEYLARDDQAYYPFLFADALLRNRAAVSAVNLEILMGVQPRGSFLRDGLEISRIVDLYALLGLPLRVTLGCPSGSGSDSLAPVEHAAQARGGEADWSPSVQAHWAEQVVSLALCKPFVEGVTWVHFTDDQPHWFPHAGLLASDGQPKPVLDFLRNFRRTRLR
ncbi:MAG: endo-1,4-beta-xylanase [Gemmatales bacterium]|nr:endo-1,4-beta-xylanase [Gemmatales bacterium]MDW8386601.1 endo-1,4-beta-xylanase [Gemmatales bacterium]